MYIGKFKLITKAQVSVFVIIAVVVAALVAGGVIMTKNTSTNNDKRFFAQANLKPEFAGMKSSILACRDNSVKDALDTIGIQGGFSTKPEKYFDIDWAVIPYYYYEGSYLMPTNQRIESEIGKQVDKNFVSCIDGIKSEGFTIKRSGTSNTKVTINQGNILFNIDMPLSIAKEATTISLEMEDAPLQKTSALYEILEIARYITDSHKEDANMICITCVADMAEERDVYVNTFDLLDNSVLVVISENRTSDEPYSFEFMNKYKVVPVEQLVTPSLPAAPVA